MDSTSLSVSGATPVVYQAPQSGASGSSGSSGAAPVTAVAVPSFSATGTSAPAGQRTAGNPGNAANTSAELSKTAEQLNQAAQPQYGSLQFKVDHDSGKMVLQVVDKETNKLLLQIPSKEALILSETIGKGQTGSLIKESA